MDGEGGFRTFGLMGEGAPLRLERRPFVIPRWIGTNQASRDS
jgi:hypothetical protein